MEFRSYLIKPASDLCNMRCRYCFYHDVAQNRTVQHMGRMTEAVADALIAGAFDGIKRFVQTDAYAEFLKKSASSMSGLYDGKAEILIRKADDGFKPLILNWCKKQLSNFFCGITIKQTTHVCNERGCML